MRKVLHKVEIRLESDVVLARQRARHVASLFAMEPPQQVRFATAVSELARNVFQHSGAGFLEFAIETTPAPLLLAIARDAGPGIAHMEDMLDGKGAAGGGGLGLLGVRRLADHFRIRSTRGEGTVVEFGRALPPHAPISTAELARIREVLGRDTPATPYQELQRQNQELLEALTELRARQAEVEHLNAELGETNRGVLALYTEVDEKAQELHRASTLKSLFLSNISHELRTPLLSILNIARILSDHTDGQLSPEQERQVGYIRSSAQSLTQMVDDLLDLAKIEAGRVEVRIAPILLEDMGAALRGMLRPLASNSKVLLTFHGFAEAGTIVSDEAKLAQILRNLTVNALKFTEQGEVRVSAALEPERVRFEVVDTGIGIAPEDQQRIFEDYTQIESPIQRRVFGTGLGLPLSRRLARLLGGDITVESRLGHGSCFILDLPRSMAAYSDSKPDPIPIREDSHAL